MFIRTLIIVCLTFGFAQAQDIQYVSAENGLIVREKPNRGAVRVGMLDYGTAIEITEHTNLKLDVIDKGEKVSGEWVKIRGIDAYEFFEEGYVFNGFLTEEKLNKHFKVSFDEFTVYIEGLYDSQLEKRDDLENKKDSINVFLELGESVLNKKLRVKHHQEFRTIEVFQKHENSITVMNEGPHCDLIDYKHYLSSWKPLKALNKKQSFEVIPYSEKEWNKFIEVDINEVKNYVTEQCGEEWGKLLQNTTSVNEYPLGVSISKIYLRIVMTDIDGYKTEKIIIFDVPMGC